MNKQEKKIFKQLVRVTQSQDLLAQKQRFADQIRTKSKQGYIFILRKGHDCDGSYSHYQTRLPAIPTVVQRHIDIDQEWADGFYSYKII